jgi:hypothetical protein|uniref:BED-type domain-containing protein n=1 Tax=Globisporangium ultimum (strain ATCC 200006 / CBS 805.95 / DAOM BR144) TaxID=431595 RepID=K3WTB4_GLOUD
MVSNKQICDVFFQVVGESDRRCRCGKVYQQAPRSGYTNLMTHVRKSHPGYETVVARELAAAAAGSATALSPVVAAPAPAAHNPAVSAHQIANFREVRALFVEHGEQVMPKWIGDVLAEHGLSATPKQCQQALDQLLKVYTVDRDHFERLLQDPASGLLSLDDPMTVAIVTGTGPQAAPTGARALRGRRPESTPPPPPASMIAPLSLTEEAKPSGSKELCTAKQITAMPAVRALFVKHGDKVKPAWIMKVLARKGLESTNMHCFTAKKKLLAKYTASPEAFIAEYNANPASDSEEPPSDAGVASSVLIKRSASENETPTIQRTLKMSRMSGEFATPATTSVAATPQSVVSTSFKIAQPEVCSLVCDPVAVPATQKHHIMEWKARDQSSENTFFDLYSDNRRIEILRSGLYKLQLYLEPTEDGFNSAKSADTSVKYYLTVNNAPVTSFTDKAVRRQSQPQFSSASGRRSLLAEDAARDDVPLGVFNVTEMQLEKWDMIMLKRRCDDESSNQTSNESNDQSETQTPFARLIIEPVDA